MMSCNWNDTSGTLPDLGTITDTLLTTDNQPAIGYMDEYVTIYIYPSSNRLSGRVTTAKGEIKDKQVQQQYGPVKKRGKGKFKKYY